jgi:hypothetical protein
MMAAAVLKALSRDDVATILAAIESISGEEPRPRAKGKVVDIDAFLFKPISLNELNEAPRERDERLIGPLSALSQDARNDARSLDDGCAVWCLDCRHKVVPDPVEMVERYGAEMTVPDWHHRLVCGQCGSRRVDCRIGL